MRSSILSEGFLSKTLSQVRVGYGTGRWFGRPPFSNLLGGGVFLLPFYVLVYQVNLGAGVWASVVRLDL